MKKSFAFLALISSIFLLIASCEKDNMEDLNVSSNCDTVNVTFSQSIQPMIASSCESCHSGGSPSGGILLDSYANIKTAADNSLLLGTIRHDVGYSPMPKNGTKWSSCDIRKLEIWIENGSPNN